MKLLVQQHVGCPTAVQRHELARPIRYARVCSMRRPLQQQTYIKLGSSQSVSLSKRPALMPTFRHAQQCCMAQAKNEDGLELPNSQQPQLESLKLQQSVRNSVQDAVESLGGRVTLGDVSARAGVKISEAEEALNALAADASGTLEVSDSGDVLYVLPSNFKQIIAGKSWLLRAEPFFQKIRDASAYLVRVTFGTALITSVVLVWVTIVAILSSSGKDDDRRRGNNNGYAYANAGPRIWFSPTDVFWYLDPYYMRRRRMRQQTGQGMNFLEAIFSFVFGDGNPNESYEDRRWRLVGNYIQHKGGVVTAEELAPYLDVPPGKDLESTVVDESYVVPALVRFGGSPEVDKDNNLIYRFPSLQKTGRRQVAPTPSERFALEEEWKLTEATGGQKTGAIALGLANLVGVVILGGLLADPQTRYSLAQSSLSFVLSSFPALQVYAAAFFAIPLIRWIINQGRNRNIQQRNEARKDIATVLQRPDGKLRAKLQSAAKQAQRTVISDKDIVYSSNKDFADQNLDLDGESFDKRLAELERQSDFDSKVDRGGQSPSKKKAFEW